MKCRYITIEREYGSGGTKIAKQLARECSVPCYGQEILASVAKKKNIPIEQIERYEEKATNSMLYTIFMMSCARSGNIDMLSDEGHIYLDEQLEIHHLAEAGPAVFLGHCASEALKTYPGLIRVFIRANEKSKRDRIAADYGIPENKIESVRKYYDKKRANYYHANTAKDWADLKNYDIVLDSSALGTDGCVAMLKGLLQQ